MNFHSKSGMDKKHKILGLFRTIRPSHFFSGQGQGQEQGQRSGPEPGKGECRSSCTVSS